MKIDPPIRPDEIPSPSLDDARQAAKEARTIINRIAPQGVGFREPDQDTEARMALDDLPDLVAGPEDTDGPQHQLRSDGLLPIQGQARGCSHGCKGYRMTHNRTTLPGVVGHAEETR